MTSVGPLLSVALLPLVVAILLDTFVGGPREGSWTERWYPPVLVGRLALALDRRIPRNDPRRERRAGAGLWLLAVGISTLVAVLVVLTTEGAAVVTLQPLLRGRADAPSSVTVLLGLAYLVTVTFWLASCFTLSGLLRFCARPLGQPLEVKRELVAQVVNRPTADLPEALLNSALIESAAENTTDSVVTPVLAFGLLGLPGAVAVRAINTLDALLGHTDRPRRYVGEVSARADHWANLGPDRLTALLLRLLSPKGPEVSVVPVGAVVPRSIVAVARASRVRLERKGSYVVGPELPLPTEADVRRVLRTIRYAGAVAFLLGAALAACVVLAVESYVLR